MTVHTIEVEDYKGRCFVHDLALSSGDDKRLSLFIPYDGGRTKFLVTRYDGTILYRTRNLSKAIAKYNALTK